MKKITQTRLANLAGISQPYLNQCIHASRRPSWVVAKRLAEITRTTPELWLDGSAAEIKMAVSNLSPETINSEV